LEGALLQFSPLLPIIWIVFLQGEKMAPIHCVEEFLDMLHEYQLKLGNPRVTTREIEPFVREIEARKESLLLILDSLPDGDGLKGILNHILITTSVEMFRFGRGDYAGSSAREAIGAFHGM
jgi:hypothetical protein